MKKWTLAPLALSIAAVLSSSAYADEHEGDYSSVTLEKKVSVTKDLTYEGTVMIEGSIEANGLGMAVIENYQDSAGNYVENEYHVNDASITDTAFEQASGNIGVNQAAGDFNVQSNSAALAAIDANFAFGSGDAEIFSQQWGVYNGNSNYGSTNSATIDGSAFTNATGNIGVNIASGSGNIQANNMAVSTYNGNLGEASVSNVQGSFDNMSYNTSVMQETVETAEVEIAWSGSGTYGGDSVLAEPYYAEIIEGGTPAGAHYDDPTDPNAGAVVGHIDFDGDNESGASAFAFDEQGEMELSGTASGQVAFVVDALMQQTSNTTTLSGASFQLAAGNIGVNMASGSSNLQSNNLSLVSITAATDVISGGGGGE